MVTSNIKEQQVLDQMNRLLASQSFRSSPILCDFLRYTVSETLAGRGSFLKEYTVGVNALVKKAFNPQSDASVRIHAGRLRKLLDHYYQTEGKGDQLLISLPKGTYVPVFEFKSRAERSQGESYLPQMPTVAVVPFSAVDSSLDGAIAEGLSNQISTELTAFKEVSVISYYSSTRLAAQESNLSRIGEILDASFIISGNVQTIGARIRINVQLTAVKELKQIWANSYERNRSDFDSFTIMDDIVSHVINQIAGTHGTIVRHIVKIPPDKRLLDVKLYDAVFWYYYLVNDLNEQIFQKALSSIKASVEANSHYALGWAILSETYVAGFFYGYDCGTSDPLREAVRCGQMALQEDSTCDHAYQALGLAWLFLQNKEECLRVAEHWTSLNSNMAGVKGGIGFCLICCGEFEDGYRMLNDSIRLNPFYQWWFNAGLSIYYFHKEQWESAYYWAQKMQHRHQPWALILMAASARYVGKETEAEELKRELTKYLKGDDLKSAVYSFILRKEICDVLYEALKQIR